MISNPLDWQTIPHITVQPLYYVSYSVSAAGAFAFWLDAQEEGYDVATDKYLRFVALDPEIGFQEQFETIGMENPLSAEFVQDLAAKLEEAQGVEPAFTRSTSATSPRTAPITTA